MTLCTAALLLALHADEASWAPGGSSRAEDLTLSLVTFGPGDDVAAMGGHSALVVADTRLKLGRLYNFGVVEFSPELMVQLVVGRLDFYSDEAPVIATYDTYVALDRDVRVQLLNVPPAEAMMTANALAVGVRPENRTFRYRHFDDNCSTRPRDIIDRALGGALSRATTAPARMSFRDHARRYTQVFPALSVWLDYMQNDDIDRPITQRDEAFLPDELERQLDALVIDGEPAVKQKTVIFRSTHLPTPPEVPRWNGWLALFSMLAGVAVLLLRRSPKPSARKALGVLLATIGLVWGGSGLLLFMVGTFTDNAVTHHNENLFFINPVTLALLPLGVMLFKGKERAANALKWVTAALAVFSLLGVAVKVLPRFDQQNWNVMALALPLILAGALAFRLRTSK